MAIRKQQNSPAPNTYQTTTSHDQLLRGLVKPRNLKVIGVEDDGERTVVDQVDLHVGAKDAVRHMLNVLGDERQKVLVKFVSDIGRAGICKRRTAAVAAVGKQREL